MERLCQNGIYQSIPDWYKIGMKIPKPRKPDFNTKRIRELSERYPPEDVPTYLRAQRRWLRQVVQMIDMPPLQRCVGLFIGSFMTPSKPFCFASLPYISSHVDCERTTVTRAVAELELRGYLSVDRQKRGGNVYRIRFPDL